METQIKTHWLQNPNKNYLGHWDLPTSEDLILTINTAIWEDVTDPITKRVESKRVVRFKENYKPLICNQTNAESILQSTGVRYMEDSNGSKICLYISQTTNRNKKVEVDCVRIRRVNNALINQDLKVLFESKKSSLSKSEIDRGTNILNNQEVNSYSKFKAFLKTK